MASGGAIGRVGGAWDVPGEEGAVHFVREAVKAAESKVDMLVA